MMKRVTWFVTGAAAGAAGASYATRKVKQTATHIANTYSFCDFFRYK